MLQFEWDEIKNRGNRSKHGIWFEEAQTVFDDPNSKVFLDDGSSDAEDRFLILGLSATGRLLIVVHCYRRDDSVIRVISARMATKRETKKYEERI